MKEIKSRLLSADQFLSKISVSGESVMLMAAARQEIKAAFDLLPKENKESEDASDG